MGHRAGKSSIYTYVGWLTFVGLMLGTVLMPTPRAERVSPGDEPGQNQPRCPDADGDGHADINCPRTNVSIGGDDCDDHDGRRFPGNAEVADFIGRDEDCDPTTFSNAALHDGDRDGDGEVDYRCF